MPKSQATTAAQQNSYEEIRQNLERLQKSLPQMSTAGSTADYSALSTAMEKITQKLKPFITAYKTGDASALTAEQQQALAPIVAGILRGMNQIERTSGNMGQDIQAKWTELRDTLTKISMPAPTDTKPKRS